MIEAQSAVKQQADDEADSEGCSSSEEEAEPPTSSANAKKAMNAIIENVSPEKAGKDSERKLDNDSEADKSPHEKKERDWTSGEKTLLGK